MIRGSAICGLVLAGGRSRRFGREKALAEIGGRPLVEHVAAVLANGCDRVAINAEPSSGAAAWAHARALPVITDGDDDPHGPLAGIKAGLEWARTNGMAQLVTAPCDTPFLPRDLVKRLANALGGQAAAFAYTDDGPQPVCAIWRVEAAGAVAAALADGCHPPIRQVLATLDAAKALFDRQAFMNVNTPEALARAEDVANASDNQITRNSSKTTTTTTTSPRPPDG